jgi:hypothetical protein
VYLNVIVLREKDEHGSANKYFFEISSKSHNVHHTVDTNNKKFIPLSQNKAIVIIFYQHSGTVKVSLHA